MILKNQNIKNYKYLELEYLKGYNLLARRKFMNFLKNIYFGTKGAYIICRIMKYFEEV